MTYLFTAANSFTKATQQQRIQKELTNRLK